MVSFFFLDEVPFDDAVFAKTIANDDAGRALLALALDAFATVEWNTAALHESTLKLGNRSGWPCARVRRRFAVRSPEHRSDRHFLSRWNC